VTGLPQVRKCLRGLARSAWRDNRAAQLVEFAVALPLLVFFVIGIFDFSNAFTLKQKLTNIARDAARVAAADPANDLLQPSQSTPASVLDAFQDVDRYLLANNINDCGITPPSSPSGLTWTSTASGNGCPAPGLTIIIHRGYYFAPLTAAQPANINCHPGPVLVGPLQSEIIGTCVSIQYGYQWRFGRIASVLRARTALPNAIGVAAVAMNEN